MELCNIQLGPWELTSTNDHRLRPLIHGQYRLVGGVSEINQS